MTNRPPRDGAVALRSLPRRFRALFAGLDDDESPDALALRPARDGTTALGHLVAAARAIADGHRALDRVLTDDDPLLDPSGSDGAPAAHGTLEERASELGWVADALADRVDHVASDGWARRGRMAGTGEAVTALEVLWRGVDAAVEHLRAAEHVLAEVRQAR